MSSNSFSWKEIEEKPENAEIARLLIESAVSDGRESVQTDLKQPLHLLQIFITEKDTKRWFDSDIQVEKKQKKVIKNKDRIREKC